jgi:hypothetical protein
MVGDALPPHMIKHVCDDTTNQVKTMIVVQSCKYIFINRPEPRTLFRGGFNEIKPPFFPPKSKTQDTVDLYVTDVLTLQCILLC